MFRNSTTYIYLAVTFGLLCYLTFIDKKIPGTEAQEKAATELYTFNSDEVTGLEITNPHGTLIFAKNGDHWEMKAPVDTPADDATVGEVITEIADTQPQRIIYIDPVKDADNLKEWGFSPYAERVVIHTKDKSYELLVGRKTALNDSVYTRASGRKNEPVRVLPIQVKEALDKGLSDFRSRNVFDFDLDKVTRISSQLASTATTPAQAYEADLHDANWTLQKPLVARAATSNVQNLLSRILGLRASDFITDDASNLSSYGLASPSATLSITVKPGDEIVLQIGSPVPGKPDQVYAQRLKSNSVFTIAQSSINDVFRAIPNVRDLHVFPFDPNKATGLSFSFGAKKGELRNENNLWQTSGDSAGRADIGKVNDILSRLSQLQTTPVLKDSAPDLKPFGLDKPQGKITVQSPEFKPEPALTLFIGKDENKLLYVRNSAEPFIYTLPDDAFGFLPANNLELRDARAINLALNKIKSMTITAGGQTPIILTRSPGGTWSAVNVKNRMVDSIRTDAQASLFSQLQAKTWLGPVKPAYGLDKPVLTISVQADQLDPTVLRIGATLPDGAHAAIINGQKTAFAITDGDFGILNTSTLQPIPAILSNTNAPPAQPVPAPQASANK
ncbi:MAG TPA: DUF4340 domain-containing protein [Candidatus Methylacidiphilales bacterium]|nr:DUF4340 domain-containing protein [Candidatus Methylacidiphilales bacterium]